MKRITRYCEHCGKAFFHSHKKMFCSPECRKAAVPPWNKGLKGLPGRPRVGIERACVVCHKLFYVYPCEAEKAKYCSPTCYRKARWPDNREVRSCVICDTSFECAKSSQSVACSRACSSKRKSRTLRGSQSVLWRGGKMAPYTGVWRERRREVLDRDGYRCVLCSSEDRIQVHHIIPYRYSQSHELDNLAVLCRRCHSREELKVNVESREGLLQRWRSVLQQS